MSGDQQVVVPNGATDALQLGAYLAVVPVSLFLERQDVDSFEYRSSVKNTRESKLSWCMYNGATSSRS